MTQHVVVVGGGMVAHRFVEALRARDTAGAFTVTVLAEEDRAPYDRVGLSSFFAGTLPDDLALGDPSLWADPAVVLHLGSRATGIDRTELVTFLLDVALTMLPEAMALSGPRPPRGERGR